VKSAENQFLSKGRALYGAKIDPERVAFWIEENRLIPTVVSRERRFSKNRALRDRNGSQPVDLGGLVDVEGRKSLHSGAARKVLQIEERLDRFSFGRSDLVSITNGSTCSNSVHFITIGPILWP
jgi:hypothetical protein